MTDENIEVVEVKVVFFKPVEEDPVHGFEAPDTDKISQWLVEGMEKNYTGLGYINVSDDWINPFGAAFYCGTCCSVQRNDQKAKHEDGVPIEDGDYNICKTCLENIKKNDPSLYKDLMG